MKTILHLSRFAGRILLACLFATALLLSAVRIWLLPKAAEWRETLQAQVSQMLDETVQIKTLTAELHGFKPELTMRGFRIVNAAQDGPDLEFERVGVGLDVYRSVMSHQPVINRIDLEGARLRLLRKADGSIGVAGLKPSEHPPTWLFAEGEVRFADIDLEWVDGMALGRAHARLRNHDARHRLDVRVDLPGKLGKAVRLSADINGNPLQPTGWDGRAYVETKRLREGAFTEAMPVRLRSGEISLQTWAEWHNGALQDVISKLDLDHPTFTWHRQDKADGLFGLDKLGGWLRWRNEGKTWRLDSKHFTLTRNGKSWPETDFAVAVSPSADGGLLALQVAVDYLRLDEGAALLATLPIMEGTEQEALRNLALHGEIRDARLLYQANGHFSFCGDLDGLSANLNKTWPNISHFSGKLCGDDHNGYVDLRLAKTAANLPGLYANPIALDGLQGRLSWHRNGPALLFPQTTPTSDVPTAEITADPNSVPPPEPTPEPSSLALSSWQIVGNNLKLTAPGLAASGSFALDLPASVANASPSLDLNMLLRDVDASKLKDYLPLSAMPAVTAQWHSSAYRAGKISLASILVQGRLADFPFPHGEGLFEVKAATEDMELDFNPDWPHLYGVKASIIFFGPAMFIDSEGGRLDDIPLKPVHAEVANFLSDAWLNITSDFDIELNHTLKFLQKTPVRHVPQRLAKAFEASGPAHLDLKLHIPLSAGEVGVDGRLQLHNDTLALKAVNLSVRDVNGELTFDEDGVAGRQLNARAFDEPLMFDVDQQTRDILLNIVGKTRTAALRKIFPSDYWRYADGEFGYKLHLQIPKSLDASSGPLYMELKSDLLGLEVKLPEPLSKPPSLTRDLALDLTLNQGSQSALNISYGHQGRASLVLADSPQGFKLVSGDIAWGKPLPPSFGQAGLGLHLKLDSLELAEWRKLLADSTLSSEPQIPHALDIQIGNLYSEGEDLGAFILTGNSDLGELAGFIDCKYARGRFSTTNLEWGHPSLKLDLDTLNIPKLSDDKDKPTPAGPNPAHLPALKVHVRRLLRQGIELGVLDSETEHLADGMNIRQLSLHSDNHDLYLRGHWLRQGERDETQLTGRLYINDLEQFLVLFGFGRELTDTPTEAAIAVNWKGAPQQFSIAALSGDIRLKMGRGSVPQLEPGLGRALGMLNLQTLRRLLQLDFSDLFGKGLAYDGMEGDFTLTNGQAHTQSFVVDAAAADILLIGRVGLADHDIDQLVSVLPHPLASIPLTVPMMGGAAVGAIIDMAHRLVGAEDLNLTSSNYAITGTWENPQIKRVQGRNPLEIIDHAWTNIKKGVSKLGDTENNSTE